MSDALYKALGSAVRRRRELLGLSQSSLATRVGMARTTITNIEAGGQSLMVHQLFEIAHALRAPMSEFFNQIDKTEETVSEGVVDPKLENLLMKLTKSVKANRA